MDKVSQVMGLSMLFLTGWVCIQSRPPVGEGCQALPQSMWFP